MSLFEYQKLIDENMNKFDNYYQSLISYNEKVNLTSITEKYEVFTKHFLDSILPVNEIPVNIKLVDVGTGAGFPGIPLKIVRPDIELTLVDSLNKRVNFLNDVCKSLEIQSNNIHSRVEDFAMKNKAKFDVAVARAVARLNTLLEYLLPLVKVGGYVIAYKGLNFEDEVQNSKKALKILGGEIVKVLNFKLPNEVGERNLIIIKKINKTPDIYPRKGNKPKLDPII